MLRPALIAAMVLAAPLAATPAAAQSFLKDLAKSAARQATEAAVRNAMTPEPGGAPAEASPPAASRKAAARKSGRPTMADIAKPADAAERKKALDDFSAYPCDDCEGGRGYDSWARHGLNMVGNNAFEDRIGALAVGESVSWKGLAANGEITVVAEAEHDGFACKEVVWKMTKVKTKATAERDGLFCYGYASSYSGKETWAEIY